MPDDPPTPPPTPPTAPPPQPAPSAPSKDDDFESRLQAALAKHESEKKEKEEREGIKSDIQALKDAHAEKPKKRWWFSPFGD